MCSWGSSAMGTGLLAARVVVGARMKYLLGWKKGVVVDSRGKGRPWPGFKIAGVFQEGIPIFFRWLEFNTVLLVFE